MSQKKNKKHKRHHQGVDPNKAAQKIVLLSKKFDNDSIDDSYKLENLVVHHVKSGQDEILYKALSLVETPERYSSLENLIYYAAETTTESSVLDNEGRDMAMLFAIPMLFTVDAGKEFPYLLKNALSACQLFRKTGVIEISPSVFLHGEFLSLEDIFLAPSCRQKMLHSLLRMIDDETGPSTLFGARTAKSQATTVCLRFLIGVVMSNFTDETPFLPEDENEDEYEQSLLQWREEFSQEIIQQTGIENIIVCEPERLQDAILNGTNTYHDFSLRLEATKAIDNAKKDNTACHALLGMYADDEEAEIRVSFLNSDNRLISGFVWPLYSQSQALPISDAIVDILTDAGINHLTTMSDVMPRTFCKCCNKPDFTIINEGEHSRTSSAIH